jgi:magnesium chelatase subunit D
MTPHGFPFAALVGLEPLKLALQLAAIDSRLSVLIRGDKGAGKSTAARGLADLLASGAPFVNLPIGATEDRLLGGLDVEKALKGEPALKAGLLAEANGGVLYVDEVNLLPDHLADALLDAVASGVHVLEREGFSASQAARFVMVGSMNPEEGALRPQILDRFALAVDICAPMQPRVRRDVIERRLSYDSDEAGFRELWSEESARLAALLSEARARVSNVTLPASIVDVIAERVVAHGVRSLRADLAVIRGSRALAALEGASAVETGHVDALMPLALAHRARRHSHDGRRDSPPAPAPRSSSSDETPGAASGEAGRVFAAADLSAPRVRAEQYSTQSGGSSQASAAGRGTVVAARRSESPQELDPRATLVHAAASARGTAIAVDDLHERVRAPIAGTRFLFVVDSSGSHAVQKRMSLVKGAVNGLLDATYGRRDEVVVIACRGGAASVLVEPTPMLGDAQRALEYMPTGGRTPLAHALELAATYTTDATVLVLLTDGHANVPSRSDDPWADAIAAASAIRCPSLVVDSEDIHQATGKSRELADAMRGTYVRLTELDQASMLRIIRNAP